MQSRRDQLQAYKFLTRRALAALVAGEPDIPEAPMRRLSLTTITGIMVAVLVIAGFAVVGFLRPGSNTKLTNDTIYIERDTGAQFVLLGDGLLHPTLNYTSAVLAIADQGKVSVKTVPASALTHKRHGATVGIDGLPQSLPRGKSGLVSTPWTVCSQIQAPSVDNNVAKVTVSAGSSAGSTPLLPDAAAVVTTPGNGERYLLWHGLRLQISPEVGPALNLQTSQALVVGSSLLNALPQGPSLVVPSVPGAGTPGLDVNGTPTLVGQLIRVKDNNSYYVVLPDGVSIVKPMAAALLQTVLLDGRRRSPVKTSNAIALGLRQSTSADNFLEQFKGLPLVIPEVPANPAQAGGVCVVYGTDSQLHLAYPPGTAPPGAGSVSESTQSRQGVADQVDIPAEKAALVAPDNASATRFIVAAPGKKFAVQAADVAALGYGDATPLKLPTQWLLLLPNGPALDKDAARQPAAGS